MKSHQQRTKRIQHLEENVGALDVELSAQDLNRVEEVSPRNDGRRAVSGHVDSERLMAVAIPRALAEQRLPGR